MNQSKDYQIKEWSKWLDELCDATRDFYQTFAKTPYLLEATEHTLSQFEYMTKIAPIGSEIMNLKSKKLGNQTAKPKIRELTFKDEFTMALMVNEDLEDKAFRLKSDRRDIKRKSSMGQFKFGFGSIDSYVKINNNELVVIGGISPIKETSLALNILRNSPQKGVLIYMEGSDRGLSYLLEKTHTNISSPNVNIVRKELPSLLELMEKIVELKDEYDYFIIDEMTQIYDPKRINRLFHKKKNYQYILRSLRLLSKALNKNIILLSYLDTIVEKGKTRFNYTYHANGEKYVDHIFVLHQPSDYGEKKAPYSKKKIKFNESLLYTVKGSGSGETFKLTFDGISIISKVKSFRDF